MGPQHQRLEAGLPPVSVWTDFWKGRALLAERDAYEAYTVLWRIVDTWGPTFSEWRASRDGLLDYETDVATRCGTGGSGYWSERAQRSEQHCDRLCGLLQTIQQHHPLSYQHNLKIEDTLRPWKANREARYRALPAGPTRIGELSSGGIVG